MKYGSRGFDVSNPGSGIRCLVLEKKFRASQAPPTPDAPSVSFAPRGGQTWYHGWEGVGSLSPHHWPPLLFFFWPEGPCCWEAQGPLTPEMTLARAPMRLGGSRAAATLGRPEAPQEQS